MFKANRVRAEAIQRGITLKEQNLGIVSSLKFENKILIPLDIRWSKIFKDDEPKFQVKIDKNGNWVLVGPQIKQQHPTKQNQRFETEVSVID